MKKIILTLTAIFICTIAYAHTINWHIGDTILETTTCDSGESVTPPNAPYKYGYHFVRWDGYTPIEYLESTGTQWIDTGVIFSGPDTEVVLTFEYNDVNIGQSVSGSQPGYTFIPYIRSTGTLSFYHGGMGAGLPINILPNTQYALDMIQKNGQFIVVLNGIEIATTNLTLTYSGYSYAIFATKMGYRATELARIKLYSAKIYDNDILVRDFIPVLDKNGVPCMYDKVEHKFYYNAGTSYFIAGPVIEE